MSFHTRLQHMPVVVAASATTPLPNSAIGGFFCTGAGTFQFQYWDDQGNLKTLGTVTGTANTWYTLPFYLGTNGGQVVTGVGATGIIAN